MSELQYLTWLLSVPGRAAFSSALQELTGVTFETSEQHKDAGETRMKRDVKDVEKVIRFLLDLEHVTNEPCRQGYTRLYI